MEWKPYSESSAPKPSGLVACYECSKMISRLAAACPACGAPSRTAAKKDGVQVVTYLAQQKKKDRSDTQGWGCLVFLIGAVLCIVFPPIGLLFLAVGFLIMIYGLVR